MDQFKLSLGPFITTLNQALELVQTVPKFTTSNPGFAVEKKTADEKTRVSEEIEKLRKDIDDLKAKTVLEEQELKLKEAKKSIFISKIYDTRRLIKKLKADEAELRRRYVETFSAVKHEPIDDDAIDLDDTESGASLPSPFRKRKRVILMEDADDLNNYGVVYEEDFDDEENAEHSRVNYKEERKKLSEDLIPQRVPVTNPWSCWTACNDFDFDMSYADETPKSFRIPKNSIKRELDSDSDATFNPPKRGRKPGVTGGRRSLGGDSGFGCRYCVFQSKYPGNIHRHIIKAHPDASCLSENSSQGSVSSVSLAVTGSQTSEDGSVIISIQKKRGKKRKKWIIKYVTPDGRVFDRCTKNYIFECNECKWATAYRPTLHIRRKHRHLLTEEEIAGPNKNIDWDKFFTKIKVKTTKVPNDEASEDELMMKQDSDWDYINENDISVVNGSSSGAEDVKNINTMLQLTKPKRYATKTTIRQPRVNVDGTYSEFKQEYIDIIKHGPPLKMQEIIESGFDVSHIDEISFESEAAREGFNFEEVFELSVVIDSHADKKFKTHCFNKKSVIKVANNVSCDELSDKLELITKCRNLNILAISGLGSIHENLVEMALYSLALVCPFIDHFIVDDSIAIVKAYVDIVENNKIKILEVRNRPEDEHDMMEVVTRCPELTAVFVEDVSQALLQAITPRVTHLYMTWITRSLFENFTTLCATSNIIHLAIDGTHVSVKRDQLKKLAKSLPQLQSISFSWDLDMIHCLKYFNNLTSITWESLPFDVEPDTHGRFMKEVPLDYWERDVGCQHEFTKYNSKRMLSAKVRLPADSVRYNMFMPLNSAADPASDPRPSSDLIPTLEECQEKRLPLDDAEKTEIDSQATSINSIISDNIIPVVSQKDEDEQSSLSVLDLTLNDSPDVPDLPNSDEEIFRDITEDPEDEYLEYRLSKARESLMTLTQHLGENLALFNIQISDILHNDTFECFRKNCPNLISLTITSRIQQTFCPQSFFLSKLETLQTSGIIFRDNELLEILDNSHSLKKLELEDADNIGINAIHIIECYSKARLNSDDDSMEEMAHLANPEDPLSDFSKIQVLITTRGNDSFNVVNVYENLVFRFIMKKRAKILRKY